jgi:hypothetical protein
MNLPTSIKTTVLTGLVLALSACQMNSASYVESADGSVQIVDNNPDSTPTVVEFYRTEGRKAGTICARYGGSNERVLSELTKLGYSDAQTLFGPVLRLKSPSLLYPSINMKPTSPCEFTFTSGAGRNFFEGAKATLMEMGYSQTDTETWVRGNETVTMTGSVRASSSGATSSVKILRQ